MSDADTPRVALAICTYNRHQELERLIRTAIDLTSDRPAGNRLSFVIVDDSKDGNARPVVDALRSELGCAITYRNTASGSISTARNMAIETASTGTDFFACIDDDCLPEAGWIDQLLRVAQVTTADVVIGHRQFVAPENAPGWLRTEPFLEENALYEDMSDPEHGNVANMMIRSDWLAGSSVRFRTALGKLGGEDMAFLADARAAGATLRFAAFSTVNEPYNSNRISLKYHLWRQMWLGNNEAAIHRNTGDGLSAPRLALRGARRVVRGITHPVARLARRQPAQWRWGLATSLRGIGLLGGTAGITMRHRS